MKSRLLDRSHTTKQTFAAKRNRYGNFLKIWHYHPELELVVILESVGTRFVGDSIEKFEPGELVLLGRNLPHMWLNDKQYFEKDSGLHAEALCIHFKEDFVGSSFLELSSTKHIANLFKAAQRGIRFIDIDFPVVQEISVLMKETCEFSKLIQMLNLLQKLAKHENIKLLSSEAYPVMKSQVDLDNTHEFIFKNFNKSIQLSDVAAIAKMNPSAFSRYFKRIHRKTFSKYLIEIRIGFACKLLMENKSNINFVAYEAGFNNISNFNKQFKSIMKMNPSEYIKYHQQIK